MEFDIMSIVMKYINPLAVVFAVAICQVIKRFLPSPEGGSKWSIESGKVWTRLMPFAPVILGVTFCVLLEWGGQVTKDIVVRGANSGIFAAYIYSTVKVSIFGE